MTNKIYYQNPYTQKLLAKVIEQREKNNERWLLLDQTVFYPGGGGQPPDRGTIDGKRVLDIREKDGNIWHRVEAPENSWEPDSIVELKLDWRHRYYQMQQHTGQHLLSAVLDKFDLPTVSVHLGDEHTLIEVDGPVPETARLKEIETEAQKIIARSLPVKIHLVTKEDAEKYSLRRPPKDFTNLRIVEIDGFDYSACGGIHVSSTAEVGLVKIIGCEKIRGHARVKVLLGQRAFHYFDELHQVNLLLKEKLNTDHTQFNDRITLLREEISYLKKLKKFYHQYYVVYKSKQLAEEAVENLVVLRLEEGEQNDAGEIAKKLSKDFGKIA
ncbi:MAG: alanyl-tRNA editing protein, partial [Calditrichaeota bacterium]|nr:alanyl-tRNA editing protein [Calditrichota bacterium]